MEAEVVRRLEKFLESLDGVPWFSAAGRPSAEYHVAEDAVVAWDDWNAPMLAVWPPRSEALEELARNAIGDVAIEEIFKRVGERIGQPVHDGVRAYFARRPENTPNTECGADLGLRAEIVDTVVRDLAWAAVETVLERTGFFVSLIRVYREGRWPCSWEGQYPAGRFVVL
jgi:hypothetical protein